MEISVIALFSGRFSPPNLGHVITIEWLLKKYDKVIICILDYPEREGCSVSIAKDIFYTHFKLVLPEISRTKIIIKENKTHFARIDIYEIARIVGNYDFGKFTYVGGNKEVNDHIRELGVAVDELPRIVLSDFDQRGKYLPQDQYMFESTRIREKMAQGESLEEQYNIKGADDV